MTDMEDGATVTQLVPVTLPGLGSTYLDRSMVPRVNAFIADAEAHGVHLHFNSAYRTPEHQAALHNDPNAITPADHSLHSAGFAVDVNYSSLPVAQREVIRNAAIAADLRWGGSFQSADPPHFYADPPIDREVAIANAARQYAELTMQPALQSPAPPTTQEHPLDLSLQQSASDSAADTSMTLLVPTSTQISPSLDDPAHRDASLFSQARTQVHALDAHFNRVPDQYSDNLAAALTVQAKAGELRGIQTLSLSDDGNRAFVTDTGIDNAHRQIAYVDILPAMNQSIGESTRQIAQVNAIQTQQAMELTQPQIQQPAAPQHGPQMQIV